jgi:sRNA-binding protein
MADDTDMAPLISAPMRPMQSKNKSHGRTKKKTRRHCQADVAAAAEEHVALVDRRRSAQTITEEPDEGKDQKQNGSCNDKGNLAPTMLGGKVEIIEVKTEDGGTRRVPKLRKGLSVSYKSADGVMDALILDVHLDDLLEPYYTIKLPDGREKQ